MKCDDGKVRIIGEIDDVMDVGWEGVDMGIIFRDGFFRVVGRVGFDGEEERRLFDV